MERGRGAVDRKQPKHILDVGAIGRDLLRTTILSNPNPDFTTVQFTDNTATSDYQALQVKFQRRLSQGLQALASYTFSHSIDIASTDAFTYLNTPNAIANPSIDRGNSDFDIRHAFTAGVTYALPTPEWNKFARATLGGRSVDAFVLARSAPPVDVVGSLVVAAGAFLYPRPNVVPGQPFELFGSQYPGGKIMAEIPLGHLWVAEKDAGIFHLFGGRVLQQIPWAGLGGKEFAKVMVADPLQGGLWLGFYQGGAAYFTDGTVRTWFSAENALGKGHVTDLRFAPRGALWAATDSGLSRIKDGHVTTLTSKNGLPCDQVVATIEDNDHSVWLYLACGIVRITQAELDAWISDPNRVIETTLFDTSDGVRGHAAAGGYSPLMAKSTDGKIWFLPWDGVSIIDPHHLPFNKLPPPVHIEKITADDKSYSLSNGVRLPAQVRNLDIDYTAPSLVVPEKVRFRVKLEGQDSDWRELLNVRHVEYTNLPPKHYRFLVKARNNSGVWNEEGAALDFVIPPAW
jgi:Y_Y_Y domain